MSAPRRLREPHDDIPLERALVAAQLGALAATAVVTLSLVAWLIGLRMLSDRPAPDPVGVAVVLLLLGACFAMLLVTNAITAVAALVSNRRGTDVQRTSLTALLLAAMAPSAGIVALVGLRQIVMVVRQGLPASSAVVALGPDNALALACIAAPVGLVNVVRLVIWSGMVTDRDAQRSPVVAGILLTVTVLIPPLFPLTDGLIYSIVYRAWLERRA